MSAETLRRAAALMRERATAATFTAEPWGVDEIGAVWAQEADGQPVPIASRSTDADAEHIASWHPAVTLAVADWLDAHAKHADTAQRLAWPLTWPVEDEEVAALAVARAFLGEQA